MATSKLNIILTAQDKATGTLKKFGRGVEDVGKKTKTAAERIKGLSQGLAVMSAGFVVAGVTAKKAFAFAKEGAEIELARTQFKRLSDQMGISNEFLDKMVDATSGVRSEFELMSASTDILKLGLVDNEDQLRRLVTVSGELGFDMNQLVLTLTNMTTMRFDALGVSVDGFKEKVNELKDSGLSAADAFREAFLLQAEDQVERIGSISETSAGKIMRLESSIKNITDAAKLWLSEGLVPWLDVMQKNESGLSAFSIVVVDFLATLRGAPDFMENWLQKQLDLDAALEQGKATLTGWEAALLSVGDAAEEGADQLTAMKVSTQQLSAASIGQRAMQALNKELDEGQITQDEYNSAAREVMSTLLDMSAAQIEANFLIQELTTSFDEGLLSVDPFIGRLQLLNIELARLEELTAQEFRIAGGLTGAPGGGGTTQNFDLTINSAAESEQIVGDFEMMKAIMAGAN